MIVKETRFPGLFIVEPSIYEDFRGLFYEVYSLKKLPTELEFVQENVSVSHKNVLRGLHYQKENPQGKWVKCNGGIVLDVAVDLRKDSPTFKEVFSIVLNSDEKKSVYIPPGFAHGFHVLSDVAEFSYRCTGYYTPGDEFGVLWDDSIYPVDGKPLVNERDAKYPQLKYLYEEDLPKIKL